MVEWQFNQPCNIVVPMVKPATPKRYVLPYRKAVKKERIFEIDFLRGFDLVLMIGLHFACALMLSGEIFKWAGDGPEPEGWRDLFDLGQNVFLIINSGQLFILEFFFSMLFVFLSGISTSFAKSNALRGFYLLGVAVALSLFVDGLSYFLGIDFHIYCGILHAIALSIILYSFVDWLVKGRLRYLFPIAIALSIATILCTFFGRYYPGDQSLFGQLVHLIDPGYVHNPNTYIDLNNGSTIFNPTNVMSKDMDQAWKLLFGLAGFGDDYFPPLQCSAILFLGACFAKVVYRKKRSLLPTLKAVPGYYVFDVDGIKLPVYGLPLMAVARLLSGTPLEAAPLLVEKKKRTWAKPFLFLGRHSLYVYLIHMPAVYLIIGAILLPTGYTLI